MGTIGQTFTKICGRFLNAAIGGVTNGNSVCCKHTMIMSTLFLLCHFVRFFLANTKPFRITFTTDDDELSTGIASMAATDEQNGQPGGIIGFQLRWVQQSC